MVLISPLFSPKWREKMIKKKATLGIAILILFFSIPSFNGQPNNGNMKNQISFLFFSLQFIQSKQMLSEEEIYIFKTTKYKCASDNANIFYKLRSFMLNQICSNALTMRSWYSFELRER